MKALSLWQPWASAIAAGLKRYETRHWATKYRGPLAIAATKTTPREHANFFVTLGDYDAAKFADIGIGSSDHLPRSAIVCTCELVDCLLMTRELIAAAAEAEKNWGLWKVGRYAWRLENVVCLRPAVPIERCGRTLFNWNGAGLMDGTCGGGE